MNRFTKLLPCLLLLLTGCDSSFDSSGDFVLHVQSSFAGEEVRVLVDENEVYRDRPFTDPVLGIAGGTSLSLEQGFHEIRVEVEGEEPVESVFYLKGEGHLGINYQCSVPIRPCDRDTLLLRFQEETWYYH